MYQISGKRYRAKFWIRIATSKDMAKESFKKVSNDKHSYAKEVTGWIYVIENTETGYRFKIGIDSNTPDKITDLATGMLLYTAIPEIASITRKAKPISIKATVEQFLKSAYPNAYESAMQKGSFDNQVQDFDGFNGFV